MPRSSKQPLFLLFEEYQPAVVLLSADGVHPNVLMYAKWAELVGDKLWERIEHCTSGSIPRIEVKYSNLLSQESNKDAQHRQANASQQ